MAFRRDARSVSVSLTEGEILQISYHVFVVTESIQKAADESPQLFVL